MKKDNFIKINFCLVLSIFLSQCSVLNDNTQLDEYEIYSDEEIMQNFDFLNDPVLFRKQYFLPNKNQIDLIQEYYPEIPFTSDSVFKDSFQCVVEKIQISYSLPKTFNEQYIDGIIYKGKTYVNSEKYMCAKYVSDFSTKNYLNKRLCKLFFDNYNCEVDTTYTMQREVKIDFIENQKELGYKLSLRYLPKNFMDNDYWYLIPNEELDTIGVYDEINRLSSYENHDFYYFLEGGNIFIGENGLDSTNIFVLDKNIKNILSREKRESPWGRW